MTLNSRVSMGAVLVILTLTAAMLRSVIVPAALGALFAVLLHPVHVRLHKRLHKKVQDLSAPLVMFLAIVLVLMPLFLIVLAALNHLHGMVGDGFSEKWAALQKALNGQLQRLQDLGDRVGVDVSPSSLTDNIPAALKSVAHHTGDALAATPAMLLSTFIFLLALYFFVRDGATLVETIHEVSPFTQKHTKSLMQATHDAIRGVVLASIVSGLVQAVLVLASDWLFGVPGAVLWSVSAFVLSFIPMVGTTPITIGGTLYLFITGHAGAGVGMGIAAVIIGVSDNFVRPLVQGVRSEMHPLITLLAIFGGLELFGAAGVFLGPVLVAMALWCFEMYRDSSTARS